MKVADHLLRFMPLLATVAIASGAKAGTPPASASGKTIREEVLLAESFSLPGTFNTGIKASDAYTEGNINFIVPVWSSLGTDGRLGGGYLFLAPYTSLGEQGELVNSVGLGFRYLFNDQPISMLRSDASAGFLTEGFYVGANVFVDNLRTQFDNDFWQLGIGAEIGSRYVELRGNYYLPLTSGQKLAERTRSTERYSSRRQSSSTGTQTSTAPAADPFATGNTIQQDVNLTTTAVTTTRTTTTTTTIKTIMSLYEEGMEGWDLETAVLIRGLDKYLDVSLIAGYYSFDNQPFGPQRGGTGTTEGWKAGIEIRPVPALVLTGMWYEDEGLTGSDWVAGIGLQIPLSKDWKDAFKSRRRHLAERLAEPVARQNAAIRTARSYEVDRDISQRSRTTTHVKRTIVGQTRQRLVIAEDIVFVNNGGDVGNGIAEAGTTETGTAEQPFDTVQEAADLAGLNNVSSQRVWNVYTQGGGTAYNESVTISASTNFIGSRTLINSPYGGSFGTGDRPELVGGFSGQNAFIPGATEPSFVGIQGYEISGGYDPGATLSVNVPGGVAKDPGSGINLFNVDQVLVNDNYVHDVAFVGINVQHETGNLEVAMTNNLVEGSGYNGIYVYGTQDVAGVVSNNTSTDNGGLGIGVVGLAGASSFMGDVFNNVVNDNAGVGMFLAVDEFVGNVYNNTANRNVGYGIGVGGVTFEGAIYGNQAVDNAGEGIVISTAGDFIGDVRDNFANSNTTGAGINMVVGADFEGVVSNNTANNNETYGIYLSADNATGDVVGNTTNSNGVGLSIFTDTFSGSIGTNTVTENSAYGVSVLAFTSFTGDFTGNVTNNNGAGGILLFTLGTAEADFINNTANGNGVGIYALAVTNLTATVSGNTASQNTDATQGGIALFGTSGVNVTVENNRTNNNAGYGVLAQSFGGSGAVVGEFTGNTADANGTFGLGAAGLSFTGSFENNMTNGNGQQGIIVATNGTSDVDIINNTANGNATGIYAAGGSSINATITGNVAEQNTSAGGGGITVVGGTVENATVENNRTSGNAGYGILAQAMIGDVNADFTNNIADSNGAYGLAVNAAASADADFTNNTANGNRTGIYVQANGNLVSNVIGNTTSNNVDAAGAGIQFLSQGAASTVFVDNNVANDNAGYGLLLQQGSGIYNGTIINNQANSNGVTGLGVSAVTFQGSVTGNTANENDDYGIQLIATSISNISIEDNMTHRNVGQDGFYIQALDFSGTFSHNESNQNGGHGFESNVGSVSGAGPFNNNNAVDNAGGAILNNFDELILP